MALSLPLFIATALGMGGAAYMTGKAQKSAEEKHEADKWQRQVMKEALFKGVFESGTLPPGPALTQMGIPPPMQQMLQHIVDAQQQQRATQEARQDALLAGFDGGGGGGGGVQAPPQGFFAPGGWRQGVEPLSPSQQMLFGGGAAAPGAGVQVPGAPAAAPPPRALPAPAGEPMPIEPQRVSPAPAPPGTEAVPQRVTALPRRGPGAAAATGTASVSVKVGDTTVTRAAPTQEARIKATRAAILREAGQLNASPFEVDKAMSEEGVDWDPKDRQAYVDQHFLKAAPSLMARHRPRGALGPVVMSAGAMNMVAGQYALEMGGTPTADALKILGNQDSVDDAFRRTLIQFPNIPVMQSLQQFSFLMGGAAPSKDALDQALAIERQRAEQTLIQSGDIRATNPSWRLATMRDRGVVLSPDEHKIADAFVPTVPGVPERLAERGAYPPQQRHLMPSQPYVPESGTTPRTGTGGVPALPPEPGGKSQLQLTREGMEAEAEARKAREAKATAKGGEQGRQEAAPGEMVNKPEVLQRYVDRDGNPIPSQTQGSIDAKINSGEYGTVDNPEAYKDLKVTRDVLKSYREVVDRHGGSVFGLTPTQRAQLRIAAAPRDVKLKVPFTHLVMFEFTLPPQAWLRNKLKMTDQQIEDVNRIITQNNLAVAHLRALGEKGQGMSSKLFERGENAFPNLFDDTKSAQGKLKAFESQVDIRLNQAVHRVKRAKRKVWNEKKGMVEEVD